MKFKGFDGREYGVAISCTVDESIEKSDLHLLARKVLHELYKPAVVAEEFFLPGSGGLYADFFVPLYKKIIETHGEQHYIYNDFFFKSKYDWRKAVKRDEKKREWCELNNLKYIELPYNESENEWRKRIVNS